MGWKTQGYYEDFSDLALSWNWQVEGNSDQPNQNIEKYHLQKIDLGDWKRKIQIKYGTSHLPFFRGYIISNHLDSAKILLSKFEGFKVYQQKYGNQAVTFLVHQMNFLPIEDLFIFYQKRNWTKENWIDLIDDFSWTLPKENNQIIIRELEKMAPQS
ncbi:MAG: hypothetical protein AB8H03_00755 [Saprospiraceae bacterium]